ncbi:MAG: DNA-3-methyladenine glycosylase, partial [Rudaea sp.]
RGPARLTQAMGITGAQDGIELFSSGAEFSLVSDGMAPPRNAQAGPRIGISRGVEHLWRWYVPDSEYVSKR